MGLFDRLSPRRAWVLALPAVAAALCGYYAWQWRSLAEFASALDQCEYVFCDFWRHYYPMGLVVLEDKRPLVGYFYSAFFALLLHPFALLSLNAAMIAWGTLQLLCVLPAVAVPFRGLLAHSPARLVALFALTGASLPVIHNFAWGQVSLLLVVIVFAAFAASVSGRPILAGSLLALGTAIKLYPVLFLPYFLVKRDRRALFAFVVAAIFFSLVVPAAVLGPANVVAFEIATRADLQNRAWITTDVNSQYVAHVGLRYAGWLVPTAPVVALALFLMLLGIAVAAVSMAALWPLARRQPREGAALSLTAIFLAQPFLLKTSWPHYFCYLPFCQMVLLVGMARLSRVGLAGKVLLAPVLASVALSSTLAFNLFPGWASYSHWGILFLANACLLPPLYAAAFARSR